jgi:phasin
VNLRSGIAATLFPAFALAGQQRRLKTGESGTGAADRPTTGQQEWTMSDDGRERYELPKEMRSMAEASFEQARKGFEKFLAGAQATAGSIEAREATVRAGAKDIGAKAMSYAEANVQAVLDYAQALLHARDLPDVIRLHSEFVRAQMRSMAEQAAEMGQLVSQAAIEATKSKS